MNLRRSQGQSCQSNSRVLVHNKVRGAFTEALVELVGDLTVGDPTQESTDMGPVAFRAHYDRVMGYIASGMEQGRPP
jgi:betaine-aldehyde dehydrogenase